MKGNVQRRLSQYLDLPSEFKRMALSFPDKVDKALAVISDPTEAVALLNNADVYWHFAQRIKADTETTNAIMYGKLKIVAHVGELMPAMTRQETGEAGGRGKKGSKVGLRPFSRPTMIKFRQVARHKDRIDDYYESSRNGDSLVEISTVGFLRSVKEHHDKARKTPELKIPAEDLEIRNGDFRKVLDDVHHVDAIITDPPYGKKAIELWRDLGAWAAQHLTDNGVLVAYSGQMYLPQVLNELSKSLTYFWTLAVVHEGSGNLTPLGQPVRKVINRWKPVLFFCKTGFDEVFRDLIPASKPENKEEHNWAQPYAEAVWLVEQFTEPGQLVIDPFAGSGTIGKATVALGRKFIGAEIL